VIDINHPTKLVGLGCDFNTDNVTKRSDYIEAKCIVLNQNSRVNVDVVEKNAGGHDEGVLGHEG
jgi:hypothetical protein